MRVRFPLLAPISIFQHIKGSEPACGRKQAMKLWSKEALVLGGIYSVINTPFVYTYNETIGQIASILFYIFALCALLLCLNKTPKFITHIINTYPKISYYLAAIGWIPYFAILFVVCFLGISYFINFNETHIESCLVLINYAFELSVPLSLIIAFIRQKLLKHKTV